MNKSCYLHPLIFLFFFLRRNFFIHKRNRITFPNLSCPVPSKKNNCRFLRNLNTPMYQNRDPGRQHRQSIFSTFSRTSLFNPTLLHGAVLLDKLTFLQLVKTFPAILWKPKLHHPILKPAPLVLTLS